MENQTPTLSTQIINNLALVAKADGLIHESEEQLLSSYGQRLGLTENEVQTILKDSKRIYPIDLKDNTDRFEHIMHLFRMAISDGSLDNLESDKIKSIMDSFGYKNEYTEELLHIARKQIS